MSDDPTIDLVQQAANINRELSAQQLQMIQKEIDLGQFNTSIAIDASKDADTVVRAKQAATLSLQANNQKAATAFGLNMDAANQIVTMMGSRFMESLGRVNALTDKISSDSSKVLTDDPVGYIYAAATLPGTRDQLTAAVQQTKEINQLMQTANATVQTQVQTNTQVQASLTAEAAEAAARAANADNMLKVGKMQQENLKYGLDSISTAMAANKNDVDAAMKIYEVRSSDAHLAIAKDNYILSSQRFQLELDKKLKEDKNDAELVAAVNKGRARLNQPPIASEKALQLLRLPGELGDTVRKQYELGSRIDSEGSARLGSSPGEATILINASHTQLPPEQKRVQTFIEAEINRLKMNPLMKGMKTPEFDAQLNAAIFGSSDGKKVTTGKVSAQINNIAAGDESNIYQAPPLGTMLEQAAIKNSPLGKVVLVPIATAGISSVTPEDLLSKAAAAVKNKQITVEEASAGVTQYFKSVTTVNNVTRRYEDFALPAQSTYNTTITAPTRTSFSSSRVVNLADPTTVQHIMVQKLFGLENLPPQMFP